MAKTAEIKLPSSTVTTTLGFDSAKKHVNLYKSASGPLQSLYVDKQAFGGKVPASITVHLVPND